MSSTKPVWLGALCGVCLGSLLAIAETLRAAGLPGAVFRPSLMLYGSILDGGLLGACGLLVGTGWWLVQKRASAGKRPASVVITVVGNRRRDGTLAGTGLSRRDLLAISGTAALAGVAIALRPGSSLVSSPASASPLPETSATSPALIAAAPRGPNLLLITIDTLRADQLGVYGHPYVRTPALDTLAKQGALFRWHLVEQPQTNPSHASIFTGTYPTTNGLRVHLVDKLSGSVETLAEIYKRAGYTTAGIYSWLSLDAEYSNLQRGFDVYQNVAASTPQALTNPLLKQVAARYREAEEYLSVPKMANQLVSVQRQVEADAKGRADITTDAAIVVLESLANQPFALWVHYFDPHYPYQPPDPYRNLYDQDYRGPVDSSMNTVASIEDGKFAPSGADLYRLMSLYQGEITYIDAQIGRLLGRLDSLSLASSTIVALTSDHGESFDEHSSLYVRGDFFHPHSLYNAELAVPLLLRYPDKLRAGISTDEMTQSIDVLPTLLQMCSLEIPAHVQGSGLVATLAGGATDARAAFATMYDYAFSSVATAEWKLILNQANGRLALFDLRNDPHEQRDVAAAQPQVVSALGSMLRSWMRQERIV